MLNIFYYPDFSNNGFQRNSNVIGHSSLFLDFCREMLLLLEKLNVYKLIGISTSSDC